jgi:hypothetical protein
MVGGGRWAVGGGRWRGDHSFIQFKVETLPSFSKVTERFGFPTNDQSGSNNKVERHELQISLEDGRFGVDCEGDLK